MPYFPRTPVANQAQRPRRPLGGQVEAAQDSTQWQQHLHGRPKPSSPVLPPLSMFTRILTAAQMIPGGDGESAPEA